MDKLDAVSHLGREEGRKLKIRASLDDIDKSIPFFSIKGREISIGGHIGHDNQDRLPWFALFLKNQVFPHLDPSASIDGFYNIELHDTYSYLKNGKDYTNCLTWSKRKQDRDVILIPDLYQLSNYHDRFSRPDYVDQYPWHNKNNKIGFWGTTTGSRDPSTNVRLKMCDWGLNFKEETDFYITKVAQMKVEDVCKAYPQFNQMFGKYAGPKHMFEYRFLLDIPGNTCSWDRVPMIMHSKSLLFKMPCEDMCFYYPLMHDTSHYVSVAEHNMLQKRLYYMNNPQQCKFMIQNANKFADDFLNTNTAIAYLVALLESAAFYNSK